MEALVSRLKVILKDELNIYSMIKDLTENKKDVIISGQVKELDKITQVEQNLILKIGQLENLREDTIEKLADKLNVKDDLTVSSILEYIDENERKEIEVIKKSLLKTLNDIKQKNELNNMLINDSLEYINFNMNLLTNVSQDSTYSKDVSGNKGKQSKSLFDIKV